MQPDRKQDSNGMKLPKVYEPRQYEADIYALWEKSQAFAPKARGRQEHYSIVVPPPNANGDLHLGHGLTLAIEDIAVRYHRMLGKRTLLLPGADHAGFETQTVYERRLAEAGKSRFDFSREELYSQIWDFVAENRSNFESQFRLLGASVDWTRFTFTLDQKVVDTAYASFKKMWDEGLIYRGERLVNYCTFHGTGFADIEVEYKEQKGSIWSLRYPLTDGSGEVIVATTRPETMLGDVAVAVNPSDKRYKHLIGKTVRLPLTGREVPILADEFVDIEFGTGAVKITPAHDINDFEVAQRHSLPMITVIGHDGKLNHHAPPDYQGLDVKTARQRVLADLKKQDLLVEAKDHTNNIGHCYKCGTVIEPLLKEQWFIDMQPLTSPAISALKAKEITFYPDSKRTQLITYLEGLRDWNISRQIAWGIPIPAFQNAEDPEDWIFDTRVDQETLHIGAKTYHRDPDVFDTWFSSSSWPYATLNYPKGEDYEQLYPLSLMETGADILYPWVSRMIMFGMYITGKSPFDAVYLHGMIQDEKGQKMSKSKGNVIDPMQLIDQYGSDAFRMGIIATESPGNNRPFDRSKVIAARNFCNKLWNVARFIESTASESLTSDNEPQPKTLADHWILHRLNETTKRMDSALGKYRFAEGYDLVYHALWDDLADWYIEASKSAPNPSVLSYALRTILKLAHPFAPFVTETIWQTLNPSDDDLLATETWPKAIVVDKKAAETFEGVKAIVGEIRQIQTLLGMKQGTLYHTGAKFLDENQAIIAKLAGIRGVEQAAEGRGLKLSQTTESCWLDIDYATAKAFVRRLETRLNDLNEQQQVLQGRLDNKNYVDQAPKHLVEETKEQLTSLKHEYATVATQIKQFSDI